MLPGFIKSPGDWIRLFKFFLTCRRIAESAPSGKFLAKDGLVIAFFDLLMMTGRTCSVAATKVCCMADEFCKVDDPFGTEWLVVILRAGTWRVGGTANFGPGLVIGTACSRGAVITAAIREDGETMTGTLAFADADIGFEKSFTFRGGGGGVNPPDERLIPAIGSVGIFD